MTQKSEITPGSKVRIAAATFSIFAFEALRKELEQVSELDFIFTSPSFVTAKATHQLRKERREYFMPPSHGESSLYGTEFEIRLRKKLTQRAIAKECAESVDLARAIAKREPLRAVFRDSAFGSDAARINAEQIFREISPLTDVKTI